MRLPFEKILRWHVLAGKTNEQIVQELESLTFGVPMPEVLDELRARVDAIPLPPLTKRRIQKKLYSKTDEMYAEKLGLLMPYLRRCAPHLLPEQSQDPWFGVDQILRNPAMRVAIECGLIAELSVDDLVAMLPSSYGLTLSKTALELFVSLYANTADFTKADWSEFLNLHRDNVYVYQRYYTALTKPQNQALFLVGLPTKKAFSDFLKNVLTTADFKFRYYAANSSPEHEAQARHWAKIGFDAGTRHEKFSAGDVTDFAKTVQTVFEFDDAEIPALPPDMLSQVRPPDEKDQKKSETPDPPVIQVGDPNHL